MTDWFNHLVDKIAAAQTKPARAAWLVKAGAIGIVFAVLFMGTLYIFFRYASRVTEWMAVASIPVLFVLWVFRTHDTMRQVTKTEENIEQSIYSQGIDLLFRTTSVAYRAIGLIRLLYVKKQGGFVPVSEIDLITSQGLDLENAFLPRADLVEANLAKASLIKANMTEANMTEANLAKADLTEVNLTEADLKQGVLTEAILIKATLIKADMKVADLKRANLLEADLTEADLTRAALIDTQLEKACLAGADLTEANLTGADLTGAILDAVIFKETIYSASTKFPAGFDPAAHPGLIKV